mmetsp:Transcript_3216/g.12304  ORF Transcript_3216/g.12304 Transcript_3216/m.12304 type:complete len:241 (+) Transcript_3216:951-1673(+)
MPRVSTGSSPRPFAPQARASSLEGGCASDATAAEPPLGSASGSSAKGCVAAGGVGAGAWRSRALATVEAAAEPGLSSKLGARPVPPYADRAEPGAGGGLRCRSRIGPSAETALIGLLPNLSRVTHESACCSCAAVGAKATTQLSVVLCSASTSREVLRRFLDKGTPACSATEVLLCLEDDLEIGRGGSSAAAPAETPVEATEEGRPRRREDAEGGRPGAKVIFMPCNSENTILAHRQACG